MEIVGTSHFQQFRDHSYFSPANTSDKTSKLEYQNWSCSNHADSIPNVLSDAADFHVDTVPVSAQINPLVWNHGCSVVAIEASYLCYQ